VRVSIKPTMIYRLAAAAVALWLCCPAPARAEGGGASLGTLQAAIDSLCAQVQGPPLNLTMFCGHVPTITQAVVYLAGLESVPPEAIRYQFNVVSPGGPPGGSVNAGNAPQILNGSPLDLSTLIPLASISAPSPQGQATPTQAYDNAADNFLYAVTTVGASQAPETVHLIFEDLLQTNPNAMQGKNSAVISLPLTTFDSKTNAENLIVTTLQVSAQCTGKASACATNAIATGTGIFPGSGVTADKLGLTVSASFGSSLISATPHLFIEVDVPLVVMFATDPLYFANFIIPQPPIEPQFSSTFPDGLPGTTPADPKILGSATLSIGMAPYPPPTCPGNTDCSASPPISNTFGICASLPGPLPGKVLRRSVGVFLAIATDGEALVSAPLPGALAPQTVTCH
jgi:hypothetical protein